MHASDRVEEARSLGGGHEDHLGAPAHPNGGHLGNVVFSDEVVFDGLEGLEAIQTAVVMSAHPLADGLSSVLGFYARGESPLLGDGQVGHWPRVIVEQVGHSHDGVARFGHPVTELLGVGGHAEDVVPDEDGGPTVRLACHIRFDAINGHHGADTLIVVDQGKGLGGAAAAFVGRGGRR